MNMIENQVFKRVSNALDLPSAIVLSTVGVTVAITGIVGTIFASVTLDHSPALRRHVENLRAMSYVLPMIIKPIISILNPDHQVIDYMDNYKNGYFTVKVIDILEDTYVPDIRTTSIPTNRGILIGVVAPWVTIAKIVDLALGILSLPFLLITLGRKDNLNQFAIKQLKALDVISLPFALLFGMVSPGERDMKDYFFPPRDFF